MDEVALQGIEFWSNVCDEEMDLAIEASEVRTPSVLSYRPAEVFVFLLNGLLLSNDRPQSRDVLQSTTVSSTPKGLCSTWSPS